MKAAKNDDDLTLKGLFKYTVLDVKLLKSYPLYTEFG